MSSILEIARSYVEKGISIIPVKTDGSKSPAQNGWREFSKKIADDAKLVEWFGGTKPVGIGAVPGPASGNFVVLDFEYRDGESAYVEWIQRIPPELRQVVEQLPTVSTPSGGRHVWIRLSESERGCRLARYANGKTKIEVRGEGHQVLAPGCPSECHPSGQCYTWAIEAPIIELDHETWHLMLEWCCRCNDYQAPEQSRDTDSVGTPAGEDSPGNDFNRRGTWAETGLFDAGWTWCKKIGDDCGFITRPGKETGVSASIGMISSKDSGYPYFYAWTTSTGFTEEVPFSRFAVYSILKHNGDYSEAAKELSRQGYGERRDFQAKNTSSDLSGFTMKLNTKDGQPYSPFTSTPVITTKPDPDRPFKWMSELSATADDAKWLWKGYIARGGITLFSAIWKAGKSTILSHLIKSLDGSVSQFLGLDVTPSRVLYVAEEDERIWSSRRDALLIGDHVGMWCRPFRVRPTMQEWREHIKRVEEQIVKHQFDLVIYDTLSKMWPVREENDAGQVEEALMPLWNITNRGTSILLVHHMRKSGGEQFVGARGSGGLPAFCEILIEFKRKIEDIKDSNRILTASGRYNDIPAKLWAELKSGRYISHGDPDDSDVKASVGFKWASQLDSVMNSFGNQWASFSEINERFAENIEGTSVRKSDLLAELNRRFSDGELERSGEGRKGNPYLYRCLYSVPPP